MTIKDQLTADLKTAMLAGDKVLATTIRGLKSAVLYAEVAKGNREEGLSDTEIIDLFSKEAKKRQESADLFERGGNDEKAAHERAEKLVIEQYLPKQLDDIELGKVVDEVVADMGGVVQAQMGQAIGAVKSKVGASVDGGRIAAAVRARIK